MDKETEAAIMAELKAWKPPTEAEIQALVAKQLSEIAARIVDSVGKPLPMTVAEAQAKQDAADALVEADAVAADKAKAAAIIAMLPAKLAPRKIK